MVVGSTGADGHLRGHVKDGHSGTGHPHRSATGDDLRQYREEHWEQDLQRAFDAGKRMAEKILCSNHQK